MQSLWSVWHIEVANVPIGDGPGTYEEVVTNPLLQAETVQDMERFDWPDPNAWEVGGLRAQCEEWAGYPILGGCYEPFYLYCRLRGMEQALTDLTVNSAIVEASLGRIYDIHESVIRRSLQGTQGLVDCIYVAEDLGTQNSLLMSAAAFRRFIKPWLRQMIDLA